MLGHINIKTCYKLLQSGEIRHLRIGRLYKIPKVYVIEYLVNGLSLGLSPHTSAQSSKKTACDGFDSMISGTVVPAFSTLTASA